MIQIPKLPDKEELGYKEKEFLINFREQLSESSKILFIVLAAVIILAIPIFLISRSLLSKQFIAQIEIPVVNENPYDAEHPQIVKADTIEVGDGYSAYVQMINPNPDLAAWAIEFDFVFPAMQASSGEVRVSSEGFLVPNESKFFVLPSVPETADPNNLSVEITNVRWSNDEPVADFSFEVLQERSGISAEGNFFVEALARNPQGFLVREADVVVIVFDQTNTEPVAVNKTTLDHIEPFEARFFRVLWPGEIGAYGRIEIQPRLNPYDPGLILDRGQSQPVR